MLIRPASDIRSSEITDEATYRDRRRWMQTVGAGLAGAAVASFLPGAPFLRDVQAQPALPGVKKGPFGTDEKQNTWDEITGYNNFYEFGVDKEDPARNAGKLTTRPWTVKVEGHCNKPGDYDIDDLLKWFPLEERIYRLRCVEAWSMVIPWVGFPLGELHPADGADGQGQIRRVHDPEAARRDARATDGRAAVALQRGPHDETRRCTRSPSSPWGVYGQALPNQNGAPLRLVVPWKYGFKSIKSIVRIRFVDSMPASSWNLSAPQEYGFYSNVNPEVDHPRWSQARERRIGEFFRRKTLMFNGYADQVAGLYTGLDLKKNF